MKLTPGDRVNLDAIDGLVLTGGTDVNPARYGESRSPECDEPDDKRDDYEIDLIGRALSEGLAILAICRGIQSLNVALGGSLIQHLATTARHRVRNPEDAPGRHAAAHSVDVARGSRLASILGSAGDYPLNSRHHLAVGRVADALVVSGVADDGVIEAVEMPGDVFVVAVQWHPEDRVLVSAGDRKLFQAFAEAMNGPVGRAASS